MKTEYLKAFMYEYGLSSAAMAEHLKMTRAKLTNKLNPAQRDILTREDEEAITAFLVKLHTELGDFLSSGLEELPERLKQ